MRPAFGILAGLCILLTSCTFEVAGGGDSSQSDSTPAPEATTLTPRSPTPRSPGELEALDLLASVSGRILVLGEADEIFLLNPDGSDRVVVAQSEQGVERSQPTWSLDGRHFAWTEHRDDETTLVTANRDGTIASLTTVQFLAVYMAWSPTGDAIAMMGNEEAGDMQLLVVTPGEDSRIFDEGSPMYFDWVPDGSGLLVHIGDRLEIAQLSGDRFPIETDGDFRVGLHAGDALIYGVDAGVGEVLVLRANAFEQPRGLIRYAAPAAVVVAPDGGRLALLARGSRETAGVLQFDDPALPTLTPGRLEILDLATGKITTAVEQPLVSWHWSPDGRQLLYSTRTVEGPELLVKWSVYADGVNTPYSSFDATDELGARYLAFFDQLNRSVSFWSPDGKAFVYGSTSGILVQPLDASEPTAIANGKVAVWSPN